MALSVLVPGPVGVGELVPVGPPPVPVDVGVVGAGVVAVAVGVAVVAVAVGVAVVAVAVAVGATMQPGRVITLSSRFTAPLRARTRPMTVALVWRVTVVSAMIVPRNVESTPTVAELPTCQKTLQAWAPLMSATLLLVAVIRVEPAWKMKTVLGSPCASRVTVPVSAIAPAVR